MCMYMYIYARIYMYVCVYIYICTLASSKQEINNAAFLNG